MSLILLLIGWVLIALGIIISYSLAIRSIQASRRSASYLARKQNTIRVRQALSILGIFVVIGISLIANSQISKFTFPSIRFFATKTPLPSPEFTQTPLPEIHPTRFVVTPALGVLGTPTSSPQPSVPLIIESLFEGNVTPRPDVEIKHVRFSTQIENNLPGIVATSFNNPIKQVYGFFNYDGLDQGVQWTAIWYRDGTLQYYQTRVWKEISGGIGVTSWIQSADKWIPGVYVVHIFIGTEWKASGSFTLTGSPPTTTPTLTPAAVITITP